MTPDDFRRRIRALSSATAARAVALWGALEEPERSQTVAAFIDASRDRGTTIADLFTASLLGTAALGLVADDETTRLTTALATLTKRVGEDADPLPRLQRLAGAEPAAAAQDATQAAYRSHGVERVTRQTTGDACPLCTQLAADGSIPAAWRFARHPGCSCIPVPA